MPLPALRHDYLTKLAKVCELMESLVWSITLQRNVLIELHSLFERSWVPREHTSPADVWQAQEEHDDSLKACSQALQSANVSGTCDLVNITHPDQHRRVVVQPI